METLKQKLIVTDNINGQMAILDENLRAVAFVPKLHPDSEIWIKAIQGIANLVEQTTSQQQTIERLREENKRLGALRKAHHNFICSYKFGELWNHSSQYKIFREEFPEKAEQLLNTTEPIDQ